MALRCDVGLQHPERDTAQGTPHKGHVVYVVFSPAGEKVRVIDLVTLHSIAFRFIEASRTRGVPFIDRGWHVVG
jgi:hypothetical protein